MKEEKSAGSCVNGRHKWGDEKCVTRGAFLRVYHIHCLKCSRVKIREYTKRGNHIRGYFTAE